MRRVLSKAFTFGILAVVFSAAAWAQDDETHQGNEVQEQAETRLAPESAPLANFVVNNNGDVTDAMPGDGICETAAGNAVCTLRAAVAESNVLAGDDVISFVPGIATIQVNGQLLLTTNIVINGPGAASLTIQNIAAASATSRVLDITAGDTVTINGLTITGGGVNTGDGGGIRNAGMLTINDCVITGNTNTGAASNGGGVRGNAGSSININNTVISNNSSANSGGLSFAGSSISVTGSVISGNTATTGNGGGANVAATVAATITRTTVSGNTAFNSSGGMFITRGTISNTTISGNTANGAGTNGGGGARIQAGVNSVTFLACTITGNTAPNAAAGVRSGIWHETGTVTITNSIVAANVVQDIQRDGSAVMTNGGFNLIGENTSVATEFPEGLPNGTNYVGTDAMPLNPMIGPLAYNGGRPFTHALLAGSVAIDKGNSSGLAVDQRNYHRPIDIAGIPNAPGGDGADIGAFEFQSTPAVIVSVGGRVTVAGIGIPKAIVVLTDAGGNSRIAVTGSFGYYRFGSVAAGETYTITAFRKGYVFAQRVISPNDNLTDVDFMPIP